MVKPAGGEAITFKNLLKSDKKILTIEDSYSVFSLICCKKSIDRIQ